MTAQGQAACPLLLHKQFASWRVCLGADVVGRCNRERRDHARCRDVAAVWRCRCVWTRSLPRPVRRAGGAECTHLRSHGFELFSHKRAVMVKNQGLEVVNTVSYAARAGPLIPSAAVPAVFRDEAVVAPAPAGEAAAGHEPEHDVPSCHHPDLCRCCRRRICQPAGLLGDDRQVPPEIGPPGALRRGGVNERAGLRSLISTLKLIVCDTRSRQIGEVRLLGLPREVVLDIFLELLELLCPAISITAPVTHSSHR